MASNNDAARFSRDIGNLLANDYTANPQVAARNMLTRRRIYFPVTAEVTTTTNIAANVARAVAMPYAGRLLNGGMVPAQNVTFNASNFATVGFDVQTAGANQRSLASGNTANTAANGSLGNLTANVPVTIAANVVNGNAARFAANDTIYFVCTKTGAGGVTLPVTLPYIDVEFEGVT